MKHLEPFKDTLNLQVGQEVYYTDTLNHHASYWAKIIEVHKPVAGVPHCYLLRKKDAPGVTVTVPHYCFSPGFGQLYKTIEQVRVERQLANDKLHNFLRSCKTGL